MAKQNKKFLKLFFIILLALAVSGCSISFGGSREETENGGVFKSVNKGQTWQQKIAIPTASGKSRSIGSANPNALVLDPGDNKAIYFASQANGLFYSYDGADNWQIATGLGQIGVLAVAVDPNAKCVIYASSGNKVFKSTDCNRSWSQVYYDNSLTVNVNAIAVDHFNSSIVYIGTSRGEIIKSYDAGSSWQTIARFEDNIRRVIISPHDSRIILTATAGKGLFRSQDSGSSWQDLNQGLKEFPSSKNFRDLVVAQTEPGLIFLASQYGILKSNDNGDSWESIELITPEKNATINAIAISPKSAQEIYYVTNTTFYRSLDGGQNWTTKKLPSARAGWKLLIDPQDTNIAYLAVRNLQQ